MKFAQHVKVLDATELHIFKMVTFMLCLSPEYKKKAEMEKKGNEQLLSYCYILDSMLSLHIIHLNPLNNSELLSPFER